MANEVYQKMGTAIVWGQTGTDGELQLDGMLSGSTLAGSYLDRGDLTSTPAPDLYIWELHIDGFGTSPVTGETVNLYFAQSSNATNWDGELTSNPTDANDSASGPSLTMLNNQLFAGSLSVISTTAGDELTCRGLVRLLSRYISPVVYNATSDHLASTGNHTLTLTPTYYQSQV